MPISFSRKTTFTSFTLTSSEDLCRCRFIIRQGQINMPNLDQHYKGGIGVREMASSPGGATAPDPQHEDLLEQENVQKVS